MKKLLILAISILSLVSCTKHNLIDTGMSIAKFDGTMYQYLQSSNYDWSLTCELIERGELVDLFNGERAGLEKITFFGPTNHSIRRWMIQNDRVNTENKVDVTMMTPQECSDFILSHVVKGIYLLNDIPRGDVSNDPNVLTGTGGVELTTLGGHKMWVYTNRETYHNIPDMGAIFMKIVSFNSHKSLDIASTDIQPNTGVVHSMQYNYTLGEL